MATNEPVIIQKEEVKQKPTEDSGDVTGEGETKVKEVGQRRPQATPPSSMERDCLLPLAQRISWEETEKMIHWYSIKEEDYKDMESSIHLLIYLTRHRLLRIDRFRQALAYAGNKVAGYYLDILDEYKNREDIARKSQYAKAAATKLLFFLKQELTMADVCKLSVYLDTKPKKSLDFVSVIESLVSEQKISWRKERNYIILVKIGRRELARRYIKMDWSFIEVLKDEWFKFGINCGIDDLRSRDSPNDCTMDVGEFEEKEGKLFEGEQRIEFNLF
ncbi:hypothetical protein LOD99_12798 [Oopsacas minuta]|uniref:Uncharacterized protein n=1 Tax=Oopsacas minuta TaxID=111878 RepID=A0AAV7JD38_9METZ|nr:hypothetical protein LOD99_12798 [Oopsacas minuta]